jgi:hypothetical protein
MSKAPKDGGGKLFSKGGRAGRGPGRGTSNSTTTPGKAGAGARPAKGFGSKRLGGRPPRDPKGGDGRGPKGDE